MSWSLEDLKRLQQSGKIRGYSVPKKAENYSTNKPKNIPNTKSQALIWLNTELGRWAYVKNYELRKEYQFHPVRKFRFDWAIVNLKLAFEYEGGIYLKKSGHNTATHYTKDTDKYNLATSMGWRVIRVTAMNYKTIFETIEDVIKIVAV